MVYRKDTESDEHDQGMIVNFDEIFPRLHPSAKLALDLGRVSLVLGAIAGIPALLLARLVRREIAESDGNYSGENLAARGEWLGAFGTYVSGLFALYVLAYWRAAIGFIGVAIAIIAAIAAVVLLRADESKPLARSVRRLSQPTGIVAVVGVLLVSVAGIFVGRNADERARIAAMERCDALLRDADTATKENQFSAAKAQLESADKICIGAQVEKLATERANLGAVEAAYNERIAKENAERGARAEREATEKRQRDFNEALDDANKTLKQAAADIARAQWAAADTRVEAASKWLQDVAWPEFKKDKRWLDATKQVDELRKRIAGPLEQQRKAQEAARARQQAADEAARARAEAAEEAARARAAAAEEAHEANKHLILLPEFLCRRQAFSRTSLDTYPMAM